MGIKNLNKLINKHAQRAIDTIKFTDMRTWKIGIDTSLWIYQLYSVGKIVNGRGERINHIQGIFYRSVKLILAGITPVYIFDGTPPAAKAPVITARKSARDRNESVRIPRSAFNEIETLLAHMGIPAIRAPFDAEALAAHLSSRGTLRAVMTDDTDALAFGAQYIITNINFTTQSARIISRATLLESLGVDDRSFIDLCILCGSDYGPPSGVGWASALRLIRKYGTIEAAIGAGALEDFDYRIARAEFARRQPDFEVPAPTQLSREDINKLRTLLVDVHGLLPSRIDGALLKLSQFYGI